MGSKCKVGRNKGRTIAQGLNCAAAGGPMALRTACLVDMPRFCFWQVSIWKERKTHTQMVGWKLPDGARMLAMGRMGWVILPSNLFQDRKMSDLGPERPTHHVGVFQKEIRKTKDRESANCLKNFLNFIYFIFCRGRNNVADGKRLEVYMKEKKKSFQ